MNVPSASRPADRSRVTSRLVVVVVAVGVLCGIGALGALPGGQTSFYSGCPTSDLVTKKVDPDGLTSYTNTNL